MTTTEIDTGTNELLCEIRERVAIITLNRPEVRNALSDDLTPALRTMIKTCGENPDVGAIMITGAGKAFCSGGNVKDPHTRAQTGGLEHALGRDRQRPGPSRRPTSPYLRRLSRYHAANGTGYCRIAAGAASFAPERAG